MSDSTGRDMDLQNDQSRGAEPGTTRSSSTGKSHLIPAHGPEQAKQLWKPIQPGIASVGDEKEKICPQMSTSARGPTLQTVSMLPSQNANNSNPSTLRADKRTPPDPDCQILENATLSKHPKYIQKHGMENRFDQELTNPSAIPTTNQDTVYRSGQQTPTRGMLSQSGHLQHAAIHRFVQEKLNSMSLETINYYLRRHRVQQTRRQKSAVLAQLLIDESEELAAANASASLTSQTPIARGERTIQNQQGSHSHSQSNVLPRTNRIEKGLIYDPRIDSDIEGESWTRNVLSPITGKMNILSYSWNIIKSEDGTDEYVMESATRVRPKSGSECSTGPNHYPRPNPVIANTVNNHVNDFNKVQVPEEKVNVQKIQANATLAPSTSRSIPKENVHQNSARAGAAAVAQSIRQHIQRATNHNQPSASCVDLTLEEEETQRQARQETTRAHHLPRGTSLVVQRPHSRPILTIRQGPIGTGFQTQLDYTQPPPGYWQNTASQLVPPAAFGPSHMYNYTLPQPGPTSMYTPAQVAGPSLGGVTQFYPPQAVPNFQPGTDHSQQMQGFGAP